MKRMSQKEFLDYLRTSEAEWNPNMTKVYLGNINNLLKNSGCRSTRDIIKNVIFNDPATIILWSDGTRTVVKCGEEDTFDPEKGFAMAVAKRFFGDRGNYYKHFKKWLPETFEDPDEVKYYSIGEIADAFCYEDEYVKALFDDYEKTRPTKKD